VTEQADNAKAFAEFAARGRKREAERRALEKDIKDRWRQWVSVVGLKEAKRMFTEQTGLHFAGPPPERGDVLDDLIDDGIEYLRSKGVQKINQKRFAQMIQNYIKKQPLTDHVLVGDEGDWDYEEVVRYRHVEDETLRKRIRNGLKRYEDVHSS
jgi:hypothetical protein